MSVRYKNWRNRADGSVEPISVAWYRILKRAQDQGVPVYVTDGHRTFAEQSFLRRLFEAGKGALAAIPSHNAPHIRTGRLDHAVDFGRSPAQVDRLMRYLRSRGLRPTRPVPGEWWHVEANPNRMKALARRILARFGG